MNYFNDCKTLEEAKTIYHRLALKLHPDQGGSAEDFKTLKNEYDAFLIGTWNTAFNAYAKSKSKGYTPKADVSAFEAILKEAVNLANDMYLVQIIGYWIYVFNGYQIKDDLKALGFWYSGGHKAWVYSGMKKLNHSTRMGLDKIKNTYGCETIKEETVEYMRIAK